MRDLKRDLETIEEIRDGLNGKYGIVCFTYSDVRNMKEWLNRAILAEDCMERRQIACGTWMKKCGELESKLQESRHYRADFEHYYELYEDMKRENAKLSAQVAALRECLKELIWPAFNAARFIEEMGAQNQEGVRFLDVAIAKGHKLLTSLQGGDTP